MKTISAADANRHFSSLLREAASGVRITITSRGTPVASMTAAEPMESRERAAARRSLMARLRAAPVTGARDWQRSDLYE